MRTGRPKPTLELGAEDRARLVGMAQAADATAARRARIVLACATEASNLEIAAALGTTPKTVGKWRSRFVNYGMAGLSDGFRPGRPRTLEPVALATLIAKTLESAPPANGHWTVRSVAAKTGLSKTTVHRLLRRFGPQPGRG
jgi:putative transposase